MAETIVKVKGEYTYFSQFTEVPSGALLSGKNINIDADSIAVPRNGLKNYKQISADTSDRPTQLIPYRDLLFAHFDNATIAKDTTDPFTALSGTFEAPTHGDAYVPKIKFQEMNGNLFFTSNSGIQKLDSVTGTIGGAGAPRGLDVNLTLTGTTGFMADDSQVAYRQLWGKKDANGNLILSAPGQRVVIANSAGGARDVILNFSIPSGITTDWFYQVYRSAITDSASTEPNDELQLVYEANPSSGDLTNGYIQFTDSTPDDLRGASLYTNASQEGIAQANDQPPSAKDIALFKNHMVYANTIQKQRLTITMLGAHGSSGVNYRSITGTTTSGSNSITSASSTTGLAIGQSITGTGIPASTTITNIVGTTLTISNNATASNVGTTLECFDVITIGGVTYLAAGSEDVANRKFQVFSAGTPAQNIADTAQSLVKVINRNTSNTTIYARYFSNLDELPGKIFLEARSLSASSFSAVASAHGTAWNPQLPTSGTTVASDAEEKKNYLYVSKFQQPEAVPQGQFYPVGAQDKAILRIHPLKESLIIETEAGVYRMTGSSTSNFSIDIVDGSVNLLAPETSVVFNNQVHSVTNQGVSTINDSGVGVISRPIEDQILPLLQFSNFATTAFAVSYESARKYLLCVPVSSTDTYARKIHVYNTFTQAWTHWDKQVTCGIVNPADDKLYFGSGISNYLKAERKMNDYTDFADEEIDVTIVSVSGTSVVLNSVDDLEVGDVFEQGSLPFSEITAIDVDTFTITLDVARSWTAGAAQVQKKYQCVVTFSPMNCGNPGVMKQIREIKPLLNTQQFQNASLKFTTDLIFSEEEVELVGYRSLLWGYFPWGEVPWGGISGIGKDRAYIPPEHQRCSWLNTSFVTDSAYTKFELCGMHLVYEVLSERSEGASS